MQLVKIRHFEGVTITQNYHEPKRYTQKHDDHTIFILICKKLFGKQNFKVRTAIWIQLTIITLSLKLFRVPIILILLNPVVM